MALTLMGTDMSAWAGGTRHYAGDGLHFAVEASNTAIPEEAEAMIGDVLAILNIDRNQTTLVLRPTVVFECTEDGQATNLTPLQRFPAGTGHEDALQQMGYEVST